MIDFQGPGVVKGQGGGAPAGSGIIGDNKIAGKEMAMRHNWTYWAVAGLISVMIFSCADRGEDRFQRLFKMAEPGKSFKNTPPPAAPDYANPEHWGCLPDLAGDPCDDVPRNSGLTDGQASAKVDCFAVYPTTFYRGYGWNARLDDRVTKLITDLGPLRTQFSVYNHSTRVFAPYFRQAGLGAFARPAGDPDQKAALALATGDVIAAFQYYLDHFDRGYPIIIAGHSQGVRHAINLLKEFFEGKDLHKRLVAAYLIGGSLHEETFSQIDTCSSPTQTGCTLGWRTVGWGHQTNELADLPGVKLVCVNPLSWRNDEGRGVRGRFEEPRRRAHRLQGH
jgi:hypothetical protein